MTDRIKVLWRIRDWEKPLQMPLNILKDPQKIKAPRAITYGGQNKLSINKNFVDLKFLVKTLECNIKAINGSHSLTWNSPFSGLAEILWSINLITPFSVLQTPLLGCLLKSQEKCQLLGESNSPWLHPPISLCCGGNSTTGRWAPFHHSLQRRLTACGQTFLLFLLNALSEASFTNFFIHLLWPPHLCPHFLEKKFLEGTTGLQFKIGTEWAENEVHGPLGQRGKEPNFSSAVTRLSLKINHWLAN